MTIKIKHKRGTASNITSANPTLAAGELAFETDTRRFKVGDGTTAWSSLSYVTPYVTATDRILGRSSAGAGSAEEITCTAFGRSLIGSADAAAARATLSVQPTASPAFTGVVQADVSNDLLDSRGNLRVFTTDTAAIDKGGSIGLGGKNGYGTFDPWAFGVIKGAKENATSGNFSGYLAFGTANAGGTITEQLRINSSGQLLVTAGSVSACGVAFSGDVNTGLAQIGGADTASIVTAGVERVRCTSGGTIEVRANSGSISHGLTYNENGGEIVLYDETQTAATLIDQISTDTRVLELVNGSNLKLGLGGSNTTGLVQFMRAGYQEAMRIDASGNVGIGSGGEASNKITVAGTYPTSGTVTRAILCSGQIPSGSTVFGDGFVSLIGTVAASFTCANLRHYVAGQGGFGASSAVTNQFGFVAESSLTGATNNYGFYSDIASASNRWNFYAAGSAKNYFNGETLIGTTTDQGDFKLQVAGNTYLENLYLSTTVNYGRLAISHAGATTFAAGWNNTDTSSTGQTTLNILRNGVSVGTISTTNAATSYNTTSDYRLKANPRPITNATERIARIKPSQWDWHVGGVGEGFIAHELVDAVPLAVTGEKDAVDATGNPVWQTVDMSKVVPVLVAALQEANARIAALEERLTNA